MKPVSPYIVLVRDLPTKRRFEVPPVRVAEWLRGLPMRDALGAPEVDPQAGHGETELDLYLEGTHVFAAGDFHGEMTVACSRCVGTVTIPIDEKLRVTFMPKHELPAEDDEEAEAEDGAEVAEGDLDLFPYD